MDKIAIISDIHGNLTALQTVLEDIKQRGIGRIYCLGDIIVKNANPDKTLDLIKKYCSVILKGNCDDIIISKPNTEEHFWNKEKIGEKRCEFLRQLPVCEEFYMSGYFIRMFHATPYRLNGIYSICSPENNEIGFEQMFKIPHF